MLKEYFDRDSTISKPISVVNFVPQNQCSAKLENSDILKNLDEKLAHLEPSKRDELKQVIYEYEHLFSDIPIRTDKIYHDVILENTEPIKQHPYRTNPVKQK
jgi:hypothetical protein